MESNIGWDSYKKKVTFIGICSFICVYVDSMFFIEQIQSNVEAEKGREKKSTSDFCLK